MRHSLITRLSRISHLLCLRNHHPFLRAPQPLSHAPGDGYKKQPANFEHAICQGRGASSDNPEPCWQNLPNSHLAIPFTWVQQVPLPAPDLSRPVFKYCLSVPNVVYSKHPLPCFCGLCNQVHGTNSPRPRVNQARHVSPARFDLRRFATVLTDVRGFVIRENCFPQNGASIAAPAHRIPDKRMIKPAAKTAVMHCTEF